MFGFVNGFRDAYCLNFVYRNLGFVWSWVLFSLAVGLWFCLLCEYGWGYD